jgi:hypothetical protein
MAGFWSIIVPEATTNLVTNPSIYTDTTGFTAVGGSITRDTTQMKREIACLKITPTAGVNDGCYYGTVSLTASTSYTFSVDIKGTDGEPYTIYFATTGGVEQGTSTDFTATGEWERQEVTWACDSTATYRLYVTKNNDNNTDIFYIDGLQCEALAYSTTYVDGNQDGCKWTGAEHASTSERDAQSRLGGRVYNLDTYGFYIDDMPGVGMPPVLHQTQAQPMLPGSLLRGFKTQPRVFDLIANQIGDTHEDLHGKRKDLLNAIKPDLVLEPQPFILRYTGANSEKPVEIRVVYDSGYQFTRLDGFTERQLPLRFIAYDEPYFYEIGDVAATLTTNQSLSVYYIASNDGGTWSAMGASTPDSAAGVHAIVGHGDYIYVGGAFGGWNSISNADGIVRYDKTSETWAAMGTGISGDIESVEALLVAPNGDVYIGGLFTSAGGVSNTAYIAKWNGTTYEALGTGMDDGVYALAMDGDGNLYAGGKFTSAGGVSDTAYFAKWNGSAWSSLGVFAGGTTPVRRIIIDPADNIYAGGDFTSIDADSGLTFVSKYDGADWSALGSGLDNSVWAFEFDNNGDLFVGGDFTTAGGNTATRIARWNGAAWTALGDGLNGVPVVLTKIGGLLYCGGLFTTAGGLTLTDRVATWNGSTWGPLDVDFPGSSYVQAITHINGITYYGLNNEGTASVSYLQTITNNGTRSAYPKIKVKRSGGTSATLIWVRNETTGTALYFEYALLDGETITLDFTEGSRSLVSSHFGSIWHAMIRSSEYADFNLLPGNNAITVFVSVDGSPTITSYMIYRNTHWSADGVAA